MGVVCMWTSIPLRQRTWGTDGGVPNAGYGPHIETPEPAGSHVLVCRRQQYMGVFQVPKEGKRGNGTQRMLTLAGHSMQLGSL